MRIESTSKRCSSSAFLDLSKFAFALTSIILTEDVGATCTICNVLHGWLRGQKKEKQNNAPNPKDNAAVGYQDPVKTKLLKGAGLLKIFFFHVKNLKKLPTSSCLLLTS